MKNLVKSMALLGSCAALASCGGITLGNGIIIKEDVTIDDDVLFTQPKHDLAEMIAGVWVDGNGCEHWIIDDGVEGYMSTRYGADGLPYCPVGNQPFTTRGFTRTRWFESSMEANGIRNIPGEFTPVDRAGFVNGNTPSHGGVSPYVQPVFEGNQQIQYVPEISR